MNMNIFWRSVSLYLRDDYKVLPQDFINNMNKQQSYILNYKDISIILGFDNDYEIFEKNFWMSLTEHLTFKIGSVDNDSIVYSNKDGSFKLYYVFENDIDESKFILLSGSFGDLVESDPNVIEQIYSISSSIRQSKFYALNITQKMHGWLKYDFEILKNFMRTDNLPMDFVEIMRHSGKFSVECVNDSTIVNLEIGEMSAVNLIAEYNSLSLAMPSHDLCIGFDGYDNCLVYSDKDGSYKLYIVSNDSYGFDEDKFVYLADNLYELLIDKKNLDVLVDF